MAEIRRSSERERISTGIRRRCSQLILGARTFLPSCQPRSTSGAVSTSRDRERKTMSTLAFAYSRCWKRRWQTFKDRAASWSCGMAVSRSRRLLRSSLFTTETLSPVCGTPDAPPTMVLRVCVGHLFGGGPREWFGDSCPPRLKPWATRRIRPSQSCPPPLKRCATQRDGPPNPPWGTHLSVERWPSVNLDSSEA